MSFSLSLKQRFLLSFYLLVAVVVAIGAGLTFLYDRELAQSTTSRVQSTLDQIARGVDDELRRVRLLAALVSQDDSLPLISALWDQEDPLAVLEANREIRRRLDRLFGVVRHEVMFLVFFGPHGETDAYRGSLQPTDLEAIRRSPSYRAAIGGAGSTVVDSLEPVSVTSGTSQFQLAVAIKPDPAVGDGIEGIYLAMVPDFFNRIISTLQAAGEENGNSFYAILRNDGSVLFPTAELRNRSDARALAWAGTLDLSQPPQGKIRGDRGEYLVTSRQLDRVPWRIVYFTDWAALTAGGTRANLLAFGLLILVLGAFVLFFQSLHRALLRPLELLASRMAGYGTGRTLPPLDTPVSPEFQQVFRQFDAMTQQIDSLTHEKIDAERAALQFQINPHFLSNTLSALRFMAMMSKAEGMKSVVEALMDMMSYQLSAPGNRSTVAAEVENLRRYETIMKVRYGDTFDLINEVEEGLEAHPLLTMLLQPLVENSIEHGLRNLPHRGQIWLQARRVDRPSGPALALAVIDNGVGIPPARKALLLDAPVVESASAGGGALNRGRIGLYNVHRRIRSHYGPEYGLTLEGEPGTGTVVTAWLPLEIPLEVVHG